MKKSEYVTYFKKYVKRVKSKLAKSDPDRVPEFTENVTKQFQRFIGMWKDIQLFAGSSNNTETGGRFTFLNASTPLADLQCLVVRCAHDTSARPLSVFPPFLP